MIIYFIVCLLFQFADISNGA